jgi:N6-adenosine-specific RNA methylase IME4
MTDWPFAPLIPMKYGAILVDTPQKYEMYSAMGYAKSPEAHYETMQLADIKALPVLDLAGPDCLLFMWSTWPHLAQNMEVMAHWGFEYVTGGAWIKRTVNWKLHFGTGYVQRSASEPYLIGKLNKPKTVSKSERNVIDAPINTGDIPDKIEAIRREHSRKPVQMRDMIERLRPSSFNAELFARETWEGHDVWGNQADLFDGANDD